MKKALIILLGCMITFAANAQFLGGFFSQKKENRKRLAEQIAALQVYKGYLQKGYNIAKTGLNTINKIKNGDLDLHRDFFDALKKVNPNVKKYSKVGEIITLNIRAMQYQSSIKAMTNADAFSGYEKKFIRQVLDNILAAITDTLDELITIVSDNQLEMKDDERLNRIDDLYNRINEQYTLIRSFSDDVAGLRTQKHKALLQIKQSFILNN